MTHETTWFCQTCETTCRRAAQTSGVFPRFSSQVVPIVTDAICVGITEHPCRGATDRRSPESTHQMSKVSRRNFFITHMKMARAFFQGLFTGSSSRVAVRAFERKQLVGQVLLKDQLNSVANHGSDPLFEQHKSRHFVKNPLAHTPARTLPTPASGLPAFLMNSVGMPPRKYRRTSRGLLCT